LVYLQNTLGVEVIKMSDRLLGIYRANVINDEDPDKSGRVLIEVPSEKIYQIWAEPSIPIGGQPNTGEYVVPRKGSRIFIFFDGGHVSSPIYFARSPIQTDIPQAFVTIDQLITERANKVLKAITSGGVTWNEPAPPTSVEYPYNQGIKFPGGLLIEIDESGNETRYALHHPSNSYDEYTDSQHISRIANNDYEIVIGKKFIYIGGSLASTIAGSSDESIGGNQTVDVHGNVTENVGGNVAYTVVNAFSVISQSLALTTSGGKLTFDASGLSLLVYADIKISSAVAIVLTAPTITLNGGALISLNSPMVLVGAGAALPILLEGLSLCPYTGGEVSPGSVTILGSA